MNRIGYACICLTLGNPPKGSGLPKITTNRTARKATWQREGLFYLGQLALENAKDLKRILEWNEKQGIRFFRVSSELIPWHDKYELTELPQYKEIANALFEAGEFARKHNHRLTTHPGPFHILGTVKSNVVDNTIIGLERHSEMFDLMGFTPSYQNKINIHIGTKADGKEVVAKRWIENYYRLSENCRARLTIENDDKASMYSVKELYELFHLEIGIPITFDYWHHTFCTGGLTEEEALRLAVSTWPKDIIPVVHYSESRKEEYKFLAEASKIKEQAHADYVYKPINTYGLQVDVMLEAKAKDLALLRYLELHPERKLHIV